MPASRTFVYSLLAVAILAALPLQATTPNWGELPLAFEQNQGQLDPSVRFLSRGSGYAVYLTADETVLRLSRSRDQSDVLRWRLKGADRNASMTGESLLGTKSNYLRGNDSSRWRTNVPNYAKVRQAGVYPGIDVVYHGDGRRLEYDFEVAPDASPSRIRMAIHGAKSMKLGANGELVLRLAHGEVVQPRPVVYQDVDGSRRTVEGRYALLGRNEIGFVVGDYDRTRTLVIDPVVHYATYLGGTGFDEGIAIAVDSSGNAYVTGLVDSATFTGVTGSSIQPSPGGDYDIFVTKISAAGNAIVYSTFLGGTGGNEYGQAIAADSSGNAYVAGATNSASFPGVSGSSIQSSYGGGTRDGFVTKINASGTAITYSTYLGGSGDDIAWAIEVDSSNNAYVLGATASTNFPTTAGVVQTAKSTSNDLFMTKVNAAGTALSWSTYLGGTGNDSPGALMIDSSGNSYITGSTPGTDFPGVNGSSLQPSAGGSGDAIVTKLNSTGTAITWSTFLGGSASDSGTTIDVDGSGNVYVAGSTSSTSFPGVSGSSLQSSLSGSLDGFVTKLNSGATAITYSTYLGGSAADLVEGVRVDGSGNLYIGGKSTSTDFPGVTGTSMQPSAGGDVDITLSKLDSAGTALLWSTYYGGSGSDSLFAIDTDSSGNMYLTGWCNGTLPGASGSAIQPTLVGDYDAFVTKVGEPGNPVVTSVSPTSGRNGDSITINGYNFDNYQGAGGQVWLGSKNAGSIVSWSNTQIVATIDSGSVTGSASVRQNGVWSNSIAFTVLTPVITSVSPSSGRAGDSITINGNYFGASGTATQVWLGNKYAASIVSWSDTQVVATIANGASSGTVQLAAGGVWYNYGAFTVVTPNISSISPTSGPVGTQVTINGTGFGATQGTGLVWIGTKYATVVSWSDTQVVATVAAGSATGGTQVFARGVWSNAVTFTVTP